MSWYLLVPVAIFFLTFVAGIPIAFGMLGASIAYFLVLGQDVSIMTQAVLSGLNNSYLLIAVPLFIFSAKVMNTGLITEKIFTFAMMLVGRWKGGLGQVNVLASLIFSGMTGSAVADASGLGIMEIEEMKKAGYEAEFACAVTAASAVIGPTFPPSIPALIYAMLSGASVSAMFLGGIVPGILLAVVLMVYVWYVSSKRNYPRGGRFSTRAIAQATLGSTPALLTPVILLWGIYSGVVTPTEAAALAASYALFVSFVVYRSFGLRSLWDIIIDTVQMTGTIGIMLGAAFAFSYIVAVEHLPDTIANLVISLNTDKITFLLLINAVFLILGMFLDVSTIQVVFLPIVIPVVNALGIDLVHFGVVICLNMMIGLCTPPFGGLLFVVSSLTQTPLRGVIREVMPMVYVMIGLLVVLTLVPSLVMFIPNSMAH